jgi:hypothetical protein
MSNTLYERDFYAWANEQAALLREGRFTDADIANIAEEIDTMGRGENRELTNRLAVLLMHLLKWEVQPERRGRGWLLTILEQRRQVADVLDDNPSLRSQLPSILANAYKTALLVARRETDLPKAAFPADCPWTFEEALHDLQIADDDA